MSTPALKITHLRKVYRRGTVAVEDISLNIPQGEFFGFLGPMARANPPPSTASPASPNRLPAPSRFSAWTR